MTNDNKTLTAKGGQNLKKEETKSESKTVEEGEYVTINHKEILNRERELHDKMDLRQEEFSGIMIRASAAIAEDRTKSKLIVAFQKGMVSYADKLARYNIEKSNLESRIKHLNTDIEPIANITNSLKDDINKHMFLYKDKSTCINNIFTEIENIIFDYSKKIKSNGFEKIVFDKKYLLRRMCEEIEDLEIRITSMELERLSRQNDIQPLIDEVRVLDLQLEYLKNESTQKELLGLLSVTENSMEHFENNQDKEPDIKLKEVNNLNSEKGHP